MGGGGVVGSKMSWWLCSERTASCIKKYEVTLYKNVLLYLQFDILISSINRCHTLRAEEIRKKSKIVSQSRNVKLCITFFSP